MSPTAKVFMSNRSQAVRLPKEFQFATDEVLIRRVGDDVILSPRPSLAHAGPDDNGAGLRMHRPVHRVVLLELELLDAVGRQL